MPSKIKIIQSVQRALDILTLFKIQNKEELSLTEISKLLNLHKSTAYHLIHTLTINNFVEKSSSTGNYRLGLALFALGNHVGNQMDLRKRAIPILKKIVDKFQHTVHLAILDEDQAFYIEKVEGTAAIRISSQVGKYKPLHCTGVGKVLLAFQDEATINRILKEKPLTKYTDSTIVEPEILKKELQAIQQQEYATDNGEGEPDLFCVAVPIRDHTNGVVAAVSLSGPSSKLFKGSLNSYINKLKAAAQEISLTLGGQ